MIRVYCICLFLWFLSSCDRYDSKLTVFNKTNKVLITEFTETDTFKSMLNEYRLDLDGDSNSGNNHLYQLMPNKKMAQYGAFNISWEAIIDRSYNKCLNLYVFEWDSLVKYRSLDSLYKVRGCYKKMTVSKAALEQNDWTVEIKD